MGTFSHIRQTFLLNERKKKIKMHHTKMKMGIRNRFHSHFGTPLKVYKQEALASRAFWIISPCMSPPESRTGCSIIHLVCL